MPTLICLSQGCPGECPEVPVRFDLDPDVLNLRANGRWVTATLEPEPPAIPSDIDVGEIVLNETVRVDPSAPVSIGDSDGDGLPDLRVKFDRGQVGLSLEEGDEAAITVSGTIGSGCFESSTTVRVIRAHGVEPGTGTRGGVGGQPAPWAGERLGAAQAAGGTTARPRLALYGATPNPNTGLSVSFSLAGHEPARLAVYDVGGREVWSRDVGALGPGRHLVSPGAPGAFAPGVYLVHLKQGDRDLVSRAVVIR